MSPMNNLKYGIIFGAVMGTMAGAAIGVAVKINKKQTSPLKKNIHKACCFMEGIMRNMSYMTK